MMTDQTQPVDLSPPPNRRWGAFRFGLLIGWGIGAIIGLLKAPRSGGQMRNLIRSEAERYVEEISLQIQEQAQQDQVQDAIADGKQAVRERQAELQGDEDAEPNTGAESPAADTGGTETDT